MAQEASLKEVAYSKLRRLLAYNESFKSTDLQIGDTALFYSSAKKKSLPRQRAPAKILDVHETRATVKFQSQTHIVARREQKEKCKRREKGCGR